MLKIKIIEKFFNELSPVKFFRILGFTFGVFMIFTTPPFQIPDGFNHLFKAYQISTGQFLPVKENDRLGGYIPEAFVKFSDPFRDIPWYSSSKTSISEILNTSSIKLNEDDKVFVDFPNTALYSPISYIPHSFSIFLLKKLSMPPFFIYYLTRLFVFLLWIFLFSLGIRMLPTFKWFFVFLGLLPMSVYINMSFSADVVTNLLSFLLLSFILKIRSLSVKHTKRDIYIILALVVFLASSKIVYAPLALLVLLIPKSSFRNKKQQFFECSLIIVSSVLISFSWSLIANNYYTPYDSYNPAFRDGITLMSCSNAAKQIEFILNNGFYIFETLGNSFVASFEMFSKGYIGTFGWLDAHLPVWLIIVTYAGLILFLLTSKEKSFMFSTKQRIILNSILFVVVLLLYLTLHLSWSCVGSTVNGTMQGRYLIPVLPLLFISFGKIRRSFKINILSILKLYSLFLLSYSTVILINRYYF